MRVILILLVFSLCIGCKKNISQNHSIIPLEYRYPIEKIGRGKVFNYRTVGPYHSFYKAKLNLITESGKKYLTISTYNMGKFKADSLKTSIDGKLLEYYNYEMLIKLQYEEPVSSKAIEEKIIDDGSKFGKRVTSIFYKGKRRDIEIKEIERHLYDTILIDNTGNPLKCFVTETKSNIEYKSKGKVISKEEIVKKSYYGKGIGLWCYTVESKDESTIWFQMGVFDMENGTANNSGLPTIRSAFSLGWRHS